VGSSIVDGHDLDILAIATPVVLPKFDAQVGEVDLLVEVREVMFERPSLNLPFVAIRVSVVVFPLPIALVEPLLVLPLELVVQDDALDVRIACVEPLGDGQIGGIDLGVVFALALAFEARVELLANILVAASMGLQEVPAAVREHDRDVAPAVQPDGTDESLLAQMTQVAAAGVGFAPGVIAQITRRHDPERTDGGQGASLRAAQCVTAFARVVHHLSLASAW
jgi:hypothetical protein